MATSQVGLLVGAPVGTAAMSMLNTLIMISSVDSEYRANLTTDSMNRQIWRTRAKAAKVYTSCDHVQYDCMHAHIHVLAC